MQIELPEVKSISRIAWARDRDGQFGDRVATKYRIEVAVEAEQWKEVASSADRLPFNSKATQPEYDFAKFPEAEAQRGRDLLKQLQDGEQRKSQLQASATVYAGTFQQPGRLIVCSAANLWRNVNKLNPARWPRSENWRSAKPHRNSNADWHWRTGSHRKRTH